MPIDIAVVDPETADGAPISLRPGQTVRFETVWSSSDPAGSIEVRLVYRTAGKGTTDVVRVTGETLSSFGNTGSVQVSLTLPPDAPPSYDGRLLSVSWLAQAEAIGPKKSDRETAELALIVSPTGRPITPQRLTK